MNKPVRNRKKPAAAADDARVLGQKRKQAKVYRVKNSVEVPDASQMLLSPLAIVPSGVGGQAPPRMDKGACNDSVEDSNKIKGQKSLDRRIRRRLQSSPASRNDLSLLELLRTWVRRDGGRVEVARQDISTLLPLSFRDKDEGLKSSAFHVVAGLFW
jgi:hypothetical protein